MHTHSDTHSHTKKRWRLAEEEMNFDPAGHSKVEVIAGQLCKPSCLCVSPCVCVCVCAVLFVCASGSGLRQLESGLCFLTLRAGFGVYVCVFVLTIWLEL